MTKTYRIGAVILARMDSQRLPGKAIAKIGGRSLLSYVAGQLPSDILCTPPILATSSRGIDDPLVEEAHDLGLLVYRGDVDNVAGRFLKAAVAHELEGVLRINGDSPFIAPELVRRAIVAFTSQKLDFVTNIRPRSYPYGVSVELVRPDILADCLKRSTCPDDREHVTRCLYGQIERLAHLNLTDSQHRIGGPRTKIRLTIDTLKDFEAFRGFVEEGRDIQKVLCYERAINSGYFAENR